jgi:hypothetical protein
MPEYRRNLLKEKTALGSTPAGYDPAGVEEDAVGTGHGDFEMLEPLQALR